MAPEDPGVPRAFRVAVELDGVVRRALPMGDEPLTVGRDAGNRLVLEDPGVSRTHCRLFLQHGRPWVEDVGSARGTLVNGQATERAALSPGDEVRVGPFRLRIEQVRAAAVTGSTAGAGSVAASAPAGAGVDPPASSAALAPAPVATAAGRAGAADAGRARGRGGAGGGGSRDLEILLSLLDSLDVQAHRTELLGRVLESMLVALDGERAFLYRPDPRRTDVRRVFSHLRAGADPALPVSETLVLKVAREREPCLMTDLVGLDEAGHGSLARLALSSVQSVVIAPLIQGRRLTGVLYLDSRGSRRSFTTSDLDLFARATRHLAGVVEGIEAREELSQENTRLRALVGGRGARDTPLERLCDPGSPFVRVLELVRKAAAGDVTILLAGETGTGKEEAARLIHRTSSRRDGPFIAINCGAIPESLLESELFGHRKGAFSGAADDRPGLIELAHGGTLLLDEVGDLPLAAQVKLLRVLEERQVQRLGAGLAIDVDFRLLTATHRDLTAQVAQGTFRQDLLYRLNVLPIPLPPLRQRTLDLPLLVEYLLATIGPRAGKSIRRASPEALEALAAYEWPGNIRELRNVIERALVLEQGDDLGVDSLPVEIVGAARAGTQPAPDPRAPARGGAGERDAPPPAEAIRSYTDELRDFERDYLRRLRQVAGTNVSAMARIAGLTRLTLYRKLGAIGLGGPDGDGDDAGEGREGRRRR
jgi:transcriptional regulator with GAF, ATPase, and Fis domain/pSer/pThr/pTyr-binding forkhead associated (FHA) protein